MTNDTVFEQQALCWLDDIYRFAMSMTHNRDDAQDLVQETYLRAYRFWHTFVPGTNAKHWLFTICRNCHLRNRERGRRVVEDDAVSLDSIGPAAGVEESPAVEEQLATRIDLHDALWHAIDRLAEPFRSAVILVDINQERYEVAAKILGIPIGTLRSRLFRARRLLWPALEVYARDSGFWGAAV